MPKVIWDAIVVGKGILGATVGEALRKQGRSVLIVDREEKLAGTGASAGHLRPSKKFTGLNNAEYDLCLETLDGIFGIANEDFQVRIKLLGTVKERITIGRIDPSRLERVEYLRGNVTSIQDLGKSPVVTVNNQEDHRCRILVVATGFWVDELLGGKTDLRAMYYKMGCSPRYKDCIPNLPAMIQMWAPYRYMMVGRLDNGDLWTSNGTAIIPKNWTEDRTTACEEMLRKWIGHKKPAFQIDHGIRPFHSAKPCLLVPINSYRTAWLLTGGGKFGTLSAGWAARRLLEVQP